MGAEQTYVYSPDYAVPPGDTLLEVMESLGITQAELAERTGRPTKTINEIVKGKAAITPETALQLERVLGVPASFWNNLEQSYRTALARAAERERLEGQLKWLEGIPVRSLVRMKWVEDHSDPVSQLQAILSFFGVASIESWQEVWGGVRRATAFRQSLAYQSDFAVVAAWLRKGELDARALECQPFDASGFRETLSRARNLTADPQAVPDKLVKLCASAGVAVAFVPELPKLRLWGATRWLTPEKAFIQLSLRYNSDDHLWFTFFHEAAHVLFHGKRAVFVENSPVTDRAGQGDETASPRGSEEQESQANKFAADFLIPPDRYREFVEAGTKSCGAIQAFATQLDIAPGIVVGRLQHDGVIPYNSCNGLKARFRWVERD
jgi:HTH-type transcriptional regulator/antitoxin HigA